MVSEVHYNDSNQAISHGANGCSPVDMCVLEWRYDWSWSTHHHHWPSWVHVDTVCDPYCFKVFKFNLKIYCLFRIVLYECLNSYIRTDVKENMSLKVAFFFYLKKTNRILNYSHNVFVRIIWKSWKNTSMLESSTM